MNYLCGPISPLYLIISPNVPAFIYYSHSIALITSALLIFYVQLYGKNKLIKNVLTFTLLAFMSWVLPALIFWASNRGDVIMFTWSLDILAEPLVYMGSFYLLYLLLEKKDLPFISKLFLFLICIPLIVFVPTKYSLSGFDISTCLSIEGPIALYYTYAVEGLMIFTIIAYSVRKFIRAKQKEVRKEILTLTIGIILFLLAFAWGNIIGSFTEDWVLGQYGLFGMPIFAGFLVYSIVRFKTFNIKLIGTQALVVALWISLLAILFVRTIEDVRIIVMLTLLLFLIVGMFLVRSVKREVSQREHIEKLAKSLEVANEKLKELDKMKSEFLSLATHQIRAPLTSIKGYSSMLLDGDFGKLPEKAVESVKTIMKSSQNLINIVGDFLNISRIEQGRMVYEKSVFDIAELVRDVIKEVEPAVKSAGLSLEPNIPQNFSAKVNADKGKVKQIIGNILDNAIKYTVRGSIYIFLSEEKYLPSGKLVKISIKDTGVGIDPKEIDKLFAKFSRTRDANKTNISGTGLGLYIAKRMAEAHSGSIKVFSEGLGRGSTFTIELPTINE